MDRFSLGGARSPAGVRASSRLSSSGALRSGAGRDLQKWLVDDAASGVAPSERAASPASSGGTGRVPSRLSGQRSFDFVKSETETTPKRKSLRPLALAGAAGVGAGGGGGGSGESNTWYPSTPDRQVHRKRSSFGKSTMSSSSTSEGDVASRGGGEDGATTAGGTMNMASIRGMDKLEIFFK